MSDERNGVLAFQAAAEDLFAAAERLKSAALWSGRERLLSSSRMVWEAARLVRWLGNQVFASLPPLPPVELHTAALIVLPLESVHTVVESQAALAHQTDPLFDAPAACEIESQSGTENDGSDDEL
jgi:hypothetical protein